MDTAYVKALHIIFVVTWFAGLFYIVRLFVYHSESESRPEVERSILQTQYKLMEKRLWYFITWPSMILTLFFGIWLVFAKYLENFQNAHWLLLKLGLVFGLVLYHLRCGTLFRSFQKDRVPKSSMWLRMWNEVATLFLVAIVFLAVLKNSLSWIWGVVGLILIAVFLMIAIRLYRKRRTQSSRLKEGTQPNDNSD